MNTLRLVKRTIVVALLFSLLASSSYAAAPYDGYTINSQGSDVRSITGFVHDHSITGLDIASGALLRPESLYITDNGDIYIADAGNNRIVHLNNKHEFIRIIGDTEGPGKLSEPKGLYVKEDGTIYVADTKNGRIAIFNSDGAFEREYGKPDSPLIGSTFSY